MNDAKTFLEIAKKDLKAAICLYENKLYPQAVFYLQQSIEKTFKSFGIIQNGLSIDKLKKKVGHYTFRILSINMMEAVNKVKERVNFKNREEKTSRIEEDNEKLLLKMEQVAQFFENRKLIESIPKIELMSLLPGLTSKRKRMKVFIGKFDDSEMEIEDILKLLIGRKEFNFLKEKNKDLFLFLKHLILKMIDTGFLLFFLSLTVPSTCAEDTRYPCNNKNPIIEYSRRNTIIKSFLN